MGTDPHGRFRRLDHPLVAIVPQRERVGSEGEPLKVFQGTDWLGNKVRTSADPD